MSRHAGQRKARSWRVLGASVLALGLLGGAAAAASTAWRDDPPDQLTDAAAPVVDQPLKQEKALKRIAAKDVVSRDLPDIRATRMEPDATPSKKDARAKKRAHTERLRRKAEEKAKRATPDAVFKVGSFNVLGASHSDGGNAGRYANGADRTRAAAGKIRALGISVIGLQEYEPENHAAFVGATGWGVFPGMTMGTRGVRNSIAWNPSVWKMVEAHTGTFPYFHGNPNPLPYVLLEHQATGRKAWFISIHNPVSNAKRGQNQKWRDIATAKQVALVSSLKADTGYPVFLTGDFNEREEAYHRVTGGGVAIAANGGLSGDVGIDWIFGTPDVDFSGYVRDNSVVGNISDHPLIYATATLAADVLVD